MCNINHHRTAHKANVLLNQASAWFLDIDLVREVCVCVCVYVSVYLPPRLVITSGVIWHDMDPT